MARRPIRETPAQRRQRIAAQRAEETFSKAHSAARSYGAQLRRLAHQVARIIEAHAPEDGGPFPPGALARIDNALRAYSVAITPWARAATARMIAEVDRRNKTAWRNHTEGMAAALRKELYETTLAGPMWEALMAYQVQLITSLPIEASQRVHENTIEAINTASRYPEQEAEIKEALERSHPQATQEWLAARATLIARTETARTASTLTEARALAIGSTHYHWLTAGDARVRESHRKLNRTVQSWDDPPLSDPPDHHSHPGQIWNCRCIALPIITGG